MQASGETGVGVRFIYPKGVDTPVEVLCDQDTDGGGWTTVQQRNYVQGKEDDATVSRLQSRKIGHLITRPHLRDVYSCEPAIKVRIKNYV